jgi:hypothetical protein
MKNITILLSLFVLSSLLFQAEAFTIKTNDNLSATLSTSIANTQTIFSNVNQTKGSEIYFDTEKFYSILIFFPPLIIILIGLFLSKNALKNYGSIIALIGAVLYFFFGGMFGAIAAMYVTTNIMNLFVTVFSYSLAFITLILVVVSFFKNTGIAITVLSSIVLLLDVYVCSYIGAIIISPALFGGLMIHFGYKQIIPVQ